MEINKILQADYLDLVFDNRNKKYGGYELRKHYKSRATKALGIMLGSLVLAIGIPMLIDLGTGGKNTMANAANGNVNVEMTDIVVPPRPKIDPIKPPPSNTHNESITKTTTFTEPKIEPDNRPNVKPPTNNDDLKGVAGPVENEGNGGIHTATTTITPPAGPPGDGGITSGEIGGSEPVKDVIEKYTDVMPEYPGGMVALLEYLQRNMRYPNEARENDIQGKVIVRFVVNAQGKIEAAEVQKGIGYGCDKEALRVVNAMKPWKPGQVKGKAVKTYYSLPITFRLDR